MEDKIVMAHGSGGKLMNQFIRDVIVDIFGESGLQLDDSAILPISGDKIAFTTDSYTITPIFFNGGNIGDLAVNGTVNDLAVMGASPQFLSCGLIIEEGLLLSDLKSILLSMKKAADYANIKLVTGDTKVVEKGKADKLFINTAGIGYLNTNSQRRPIKIGDKIIINGTIGDHAISIMAERNGLSFSKQLKSDCAPLNHLIAAIIKKFPNDIHFMRDATRGGAASVLNEIINDKPFGIRLFETEFPLKDEVIGVCDILGIDPLYAANEGKMIMVVKQENAQDMIQLMSKFKEGKNSSIIGEVTEMYPGKVYVETEVGGKRMVSLLIDDQLPRIC